MFEPSLTSPTTAASDFFAALGSLPAQCIKCGSGGGDHHKCKKLVKKIFNDEDCVYGKHLCSINGVYAARACSSA